MLPVGDLPTTPAIEQETRTAVAEVGREALLTLLSRPSFAVSSETSAGYYLNGVFVHDTDAGLAAVATDGQRLARIILPGVTGLSRDRRLIVPRPAIKILLKLLADKEVGLLTLRRSASLLEITSTKFTFISKLIDAEFPTYETLVPAPTDNTAIVDRTALVQAVARIAAVAPDDKHLPLVGLTWKAPGTLQLCVPETPELADDQIEAEMISGRCRTAVQVRHLKQLLDELASDRVRIDAGAGAGSPILITDPGSPNFAIVQMPCSWKAQASQAA